MRKINLELYGTLPVTFIEEVMFSIVGAILLV